MRISTSTIYEQGVATLQRQQAEMLHTQQQVATGRRMLTPSDDPVASARALEVTQSLSTTQQFSKNAAAAADSLALQDGILGSVNELILDVQVLAVSVGNPTLNDAGRASIATNLRGRYQELMGLANSTDGNGQYLFSGYQGNTLPFTSAALGSVTYQGDQGQRLMQISPSRQMAVSDSGADVFQRIKNGNGTFVAAAATGNTGTGLVSPGSVLTGYNGHNYSVQFTVAAGVTTYAVNDVTTGAPVVAAGAPYTSDGSIAFDGIQLSIKGAPANGDTFTLSPSSNQDIFATLGNLITALETPVTDGASNAKLFNTLSATMQNLDHGLTNVTKARAAVGTREVEAESTKTLNSDLELQYQQILSNLQDVDPYEAISLLTQQKTNLEAAQQSYLKVTGLSLFNYM